MKKTGQLLKNARESKGISLQEVSLHLKISTRTLKALEDGEMNQLPAKTFLRGFVQSYSQFLKINLNDIMVVFQEEMGTTHPGMITTHVAPPPTNYSPKATETTPENPENLTQSTSNQESTQSINPSANIKSQVVKTPKEPVAPVAPTLSVDPKTWANSVKIGTAAFIILLIIIIYTIKRTVDKYEKEAQLPTAESQVNTLPPTDDDNTPAATDLQDNVEPQVSPSIIPDASAIDSLNLSTKPTNTPIPESTALAIAPVTASPTPTLTPSISTDVQTTQEIIIEALDRVSVDFQIDDGSKETILLQAERIHTFKARKKIKLTFSDGGSVNLIYNGKDLGVPGNLGQNYSVTFPKSGHD